MYDRDDEELPPSQQDSIKELKTVAFLLNGLYKQLADERDTITMASSQMTHAAKQFQAHLAKFEAFEKAIKQHIVQAIQQETQQAASAMANTVGDKLAEAASEQIDDALAELKKSASHAKAQLDECRTELKRFELWRWVGFIMIALSGGLIGALATHHYLPEQTFTKEQWNQIDAGKTLIKAWGQLNKNEQDKILALSRGEKPPQPTPLPKKKKTRQVEPVEDYNSDISPESVSEPEAY